MSKAVRIHEVGGPEVLKFETVEVGDPGPGQALLRHQRQSQREDHRRDDQQAPWGSNRWNLKTRRPTAS